MKNIVDNLQIILLKEEGNSNRKVANKLNIDRKTVARYWNEYVKYKVKLNEFNAPIKEIQEKIVEAPKYNRENRIRLKFTDEVEKRLKEILESEDRKDKILGNHK